ncbi:MAG: phosphoribosylformylglycinamidine synthase subunit PurQ [Candidatus Dadabacteria bacterium]|nr:MAG: phosphoribosylformylglycinamidine synthase subunit PurQ [Candidatus Dadabacteria bacterium]
MKVAVTLFPGSNCDHDVLYTFNKLLSADSYLVWHRERDLGNPDAVIIPGGFSYGDYLRCGALAKVSPVMESVIEFAGRGGPVLGICNGFQILCESGLLPGVLLQNIERKFLSRFVHIKVENNSTPFSCQYQEGEIITCPIAHFEGNYFASREELKALEDNGQVIFRYCDADGKVAADDRAINPNGSLNSIAGVSNSKGNVVGLMPHPERAAEQLVGWVGGDSGLGVFKSLLS